MTDIQYLAPATLDEAIGAYAAAAGAGRILAGGTDLLVQMRSGLVRPGLIVDIKKISEVTSVAETDDGGFVVGAAVSGAVLLEHPRFSNAWPGVLEALNLIGSTQIQGRASLGGNLCNGKPARDSGPTQHKPRGHGFGEGRRIGHNNVVHQSVITTDGETFIDLHGLALCDTPTLIEIRPTDSCGVNK